MQNRFGTDMIATCGQKNWREIADEKDARIARLKEALAKISGMTTPTTPNQQLAEARYIARESLGWFD